MLYSLRIENLALMDSVHLEMEEGFTTVTGETGAGKSVLLGALSLLSGARAEKSLIRQGSDTCTLEAAFSLKAHQQIDKKLDEMGLPQTEEGQLLIKRILSNSKPSRIMINGAMATLTQLQQIGTQWIDFHGPGEPQKLFHEKEQLALLDLYTGLKEELDSYRNHYRRWRECIDQMEKMRHQARLSPEEAAFLQSQVEEIDFLRLSEDRISQLEEDFRRLSGGQELKDLCNKLDESFLGTKGICQNLEHALPVARKLAQLDPSAAGLCDRVESLVIEANDLSTEWRELAFQSDFDAHQIRQIESDMEKWMSLKRRYGVSVSAVLAKCEEMRERLSLQGNLDEVLGEKQAEANALEKELIGLAAGMRSMRLKSAHKLGKACEKLLLQLGFKHPKLNIEIHPREKLGPTGDCDCRMTFSPNPGSAPLPLNKIASSGEMARVMLALKSVLASVDSTPVLVFDEVDSNIGGEVATAVAQLLGKLGKEHQVFCITHLPQVAAVAENHYVVEKSQTDESTQITIRSLSEDNDARIDEFARMLGDRKSKSARDHAREMIGLT